MITDRIYNLVKTGMITFGKKYSAWSITDNSNIPDVDVNNSVMDSLGSGIYGVISIKTTS
ncbi:hypothetical protein [Candidatus Hodgkinia cicadicola]|uniref:hypothetical protein n=1 Tax=Candidatus Hodgkinia cicadicola TaxID=573658 RepID=UPI001788E1A3